MALAKISHSEETVNMYIFLKQVLIKKTTELLHLLFKNSYQKIKPYKQMPWQKKFIISKNRSSE